MAALADSDYEVITLGDGSLRVAPKAEFFKGAYTYAAVRAADVPAATAAAVDRWKSYVRGDLALKHALVVRWFRPARDGEPVALRSDVALRGQYSNDRVATVWLSADLAPLEAVETLAHEGRHMKQWQDYGRGYRAARPRADSHADEHEALQYGRLVRKFVELPTQQAVDLMAEACGVPAWKARAWDAADRRWEQKHGRAL
jgi:hypothetical protein